MLYYATAAFGLEGAVSAELKRLGMKGVTAENGGVYFSGNIDDALRCNIASRFADRILLQVADCECMTFEDLFQTVKKVDWENYATGIESIDISCKCARSKLMSTRDCQSVSKKAIIERLRANGRIEYFPESGPSLPVHITIHNNRTRVFINTSGAGLSRRGYRLLNGEAPIRETLASALVEFSPWRPGMHLHDPCCGTGTIPIEAALRKMHRAPGLNRRFAMDDLKKLSSVNAGSIRSDFKNEVITETDLMISGSDIDSEVLKLASFHQAKADIGEHIHFFQSSVSDLNMPADNGVFICNPPYGERLNDKKECAGIYHDLGLLKKRHSGWSLCAITADPSFERSFGKRADRKRRLYNGTLECTYYIYL